MVQIRVISVDQVSFHCEIYTTFFDFMNSFFGVKNSKNFAFIYTKKINVNIGSKSYFNMKLFVSGVVHVVQKIQMDPHPQSCLVETHPNLQLVRANKETTLLQIIPHS